MFKSLDQCEWFGCCCCLEQDCDFNENSCSELCSETYTHMQCVYYTYIQCMHNLLMREFSSEDDQIVVLEKYIRLSGMLKETLICF